MGNRSGIQCIGFFRNWLLKAEPQEINVYFEQLEKERSSIKQQITEICWYMRGSITWEEAWSLSETDRNDITKFIGENAERFKKSGQVVV